MGLLEKITDAESSDWLCKDMTDEEVIKVISEAKEEARKRIKLVDTLDKIKAEINSYGSIWVEYKIIGHTDQDIENIVENVLKQAKKQVLDIIDKYKAESEE